MDHPTVKIEPTDIYENVETKVFQDAMNREMNCIDVDLPCPDFVRCAKSGIGEFAGEGIFATRDIPKGYCFGRYCPNGVEQKIPDIEKDTVSFYGLTYRDDFDVKIFVDGMGFNGKILHWTAKINHSFTPNVIVGTNGLLTTISDSKKKLKKGQIPVVVPQIKKGDELFINYSVGYWRAALPMTKTFDDAQLKLLFEFNVCELFFMETIFEKFDNGHIHDDIVRSIVQNELSRNSKLIVNEIILENVLAQYYLTKYNVRKDQLISKLRALKKTQIARLGFLFDNTTTADIEQMWNIHEEHRLAEIQKRKNMEHKDRVQKRIVSQRVDEGIDFVITHVGKQKKAKKNIVVKIENQEENVINDKKQDYVMNEKEEENVMSVIDERLEMNKKTKETLMNEEENETLKIDQKEGLEYYSSIVIGDCSYLSGPSDLPELSNLFDLPELSKELDYSFSGNIFNIDEHASLLTQDDSFLQNIDFISHMNNDTQQLINSEKDTQQLNDSEDDSEDESKNNKQQLIESENDNKQQLNDNTQQLIENVNPDFNNHVAFENYVIVENQKNQANDFSQQQFFVLPPVDFSHFNANGERKSKLTEKSQNIKIAKRCGRKTTTDKTCLCGFKDNEIEWIVKWQQPFLSYLRNHPKNFENGTITKCEDEVRLCFRHGFAVEDLNTSLALKMEITCSRKNKIKNESVSVQTGGYRRNGLLHFQDFYLQLRK